jgi:hypothetical protein
MGKLPGEGDSLNSAVGFGWGRGTHRTLQATMMATSPCGLMSAAGLTDEQTFFDPRGVAVISHHGFGQLAFPLG